MIFQIIQYSVISLLTIVIVHYLISHLTENLTTPQVRDIVSSTNEHYETIIKKLESRAENKTKKNAKIPNNSDSMKADLKQYLSSLNNGANSNMNTNTQTPVFSPPTSLSSQQINTYDDYASTDELAYSSY